MLVSWYKNVGDQGNPNSDFLESFRLFALCNSQIKYVHFAFIISLNHDWFKSYDRFKMYGCIKVTFEKTAPEDVSKPQVNHISQI